RHALAVRLVAGDAVGRIDLLASGHEFVEFVGLGGIVGGGLHGGLLFGSPFLVLGLFHDFDHDGHEGVVLATEFGALAAIDTDLFGAEPGVTQHTRHGVLFDAEMRHHPRVDDVVGGQHHPHLLVH